MKLRSTMTAVLLATAILLPAVVRADPETVEGLIKKRSVAGNGEQPASAGKQQKAWSVPVLAHKPNENKPTAVEGGYPDFQPDSLSRLLRSNDGQGNKYTIGWLV